MAKQSFSVGQVLTASQMLSLQQTAMLGGSTTAKTASYALIAADAGTVVSVNSTSATTITINTGLFSAGDTVTIQNWGSGAITITAGTATVNTAGSLIVPQYDGGVLYFISASAAIYFDFVQAGAVSPLTTKGDVYTFSTSDTRLGVGANNTILTADSAEATGLKWATPSSGGMTSLASGSFSASGTAFDISSISDSYNELWLYLTNWSTNYSSDTSAYLRLNNDSGSNYLSYQITATPTLNRIAGTDRINVVELFASNSGLGGWVRFPNYAATTGNKPISWAVQGPPSYMYQGNAFWSASSAINRISLTLGASQTFAGGSYALWGVK